MKILKQSYKISPKPINFTQSQSHKKNRSPQQKMNPAPYSGMGFNNAFRDFLLGVPSIDILNLLIEKCATEVS